MTSWIVKIGKDTPQHWDFARDDGFWDVRRPGFFNRIKPGDDIYFWLAKAGLLARTRATTRLYELGPTSASAHWIDAENGGYTHRFEFETVSESLVMPASWNEIQQQHGRKYAAQAPANEIADTKAEAHLRSLFYVRSDFIFDDLPSFGDGQYGVPIQYEKGEDLRARGRREITVRRGQKKFRKALFAAYEDRCAVTGSAVPAVLEAAHIDRYFGEHSNHVTNGLLLRADLHTLFDLQLWTVTDELAIELAPALKSSEYAAFDGATLRLPADPLQRPDRDALGRHRVSSGVMQLGHTDKLGPPCTSHHFTATQT